MASSCSLDIHITVVSAKHLQNVNWKHGELKPYVIFWVGPDNRLATKPDESGSTSPVWNERFTLSVNRPPDYPVLALEVFHCNPSETPKPLVGSLQIPLTDLVNSDDSDCIRTFQLLRPSGRPQGKIRLKLAVRDRPSTPAPDFQLTPPPLVTYFSSYPPPPVPDPKEYSYLSDDFPPLPPTQAPDPRGYSYLSDDCPPLPPPQSWSPHPYPYAAYSYPYYGYYEYYSRPPPPPRQFFNWSANYGVPSAPAPAPVDQRQMGVKYEEAKIKERANSEFSAC